MKRIAPYALSVVLLVGVGAAVIECTGSVCGNGVKESGEQCDNGMLNGTQGNGCSAQCTLTSISRARLTVNVERLNVTVASYPDYPAPTCMDLGISKVHLVLTGPAPQDMTTDCNNPSFSFDPIAPGTYQATVTLLDASGAPLTKPITSTMVDVEPAPTPTTLNLAFEIGDYLKSYTGNFDFMASWGADNIACSQATPAVTKQTITMTLPGSTTPVAMMTNDGESLDGTPFTCFQPAAAPKYQEVKMMPWGHYDLTITGESGPPGPKMTSYCQKFDVFVGVGVATPTYALTVAGASMADGGVGDGGMTCP
jgi:cysteine-rich repeat protein